MSPSGSTLERLARRAADRVPVVRAFGGTGQIEQAARGARDARAELGGTMPLVREVLGDLPAFGRLLWRLARDERVARRHRGALFGLALYVVSPIDPIPDWLPVVGASDDALVVVGGLRWVLRSVDAEVLAEHWDGDPVVLELLTGREQVHDQVSASAAGD